MDMKMWTILLFPLAWIYGLIMGIRNRLFDWGISFSLKIKQNSIGVGNLSVGGTGKSVVIDYLIDLFKPTHSIFVVSRGYKRKTKGVVIASEKSTAETIGDEPYQFFVKHKGIGVVVAEKRISGIKAINQLRSQPSFFLLDDVMQHRHVNPKIMILTTSFQHPYFNDYLLPYGRLRESRSGAKRAQIILVTKCPAELTLAKQHIFQKKLRLQANQHLFFAKINYSEEILNHEKRKSLETLTTSFLLITGVANPDPLVSFLEAKGQKFNHLKFPNHHRFRTGDITKIKQLKGDRVILTTEKDFGRLMPYFSTSELYYLPISMGFVNKDDTLRFKLTLEEAMSSS